MPSPAADTKGPMIGSIIIVILLVIGAIYIFSQRRPASEEIPGLADETAILDDTGTTASEAAIFLDGDSEPTLGSFSSDIEQVENAF